MQSVGTKVGSSGTLGMDLECCCMEKASPPKSLGQVPPSSACQLLCPFSDGAETLAEAEAINY